MGAPTEHRAVGILGTGSYLPAEAVPNHLVAERAGVTADWIEAKTGIRSRRYAAEDEATSDLAAAAARHALDAAGVAPGRVDWVVVATSTPDHPQPATACLVQERVGAVNAAAFDVNAVCSGFVFALVVAARLLQSPGAAPGGHALVIGADVYSRIIDRSDRRTAVLFGDGAGAVVLGPVGAGRGLVGAHAASHGALHDLIKVPAGGSREPASEQTVAEGRHSFRMSGRSVTEYVMTELPAAVRATLAENGVDGASVDHFVPHQANGVMLDRVLPGLGLPRARVHLTVAEHGNTSAASIPLALDAARRQGAFADGDLLLLAGFGGGMSLGTALVRWQGSENGAR
ncbi:3-oxoacyl-ACP synthase III family protein [Streptomyces longwoodensis]|uniref:3-oxoacyl-ACP synthase III family protein n=1 Tax=Streptomyces longwoodensis TaxID=68231 RepID=UPI0033FABF44